MSGGAEAGDYVASEGVDCDDAVWRVVDYSSGSGVDCEDVVGASADCDDGWSTEDYVVLVYAD